MRISDWSSDVCSSDLRASSLNRKTSEEPTTFAHRGDRPGKRVALLYKFVLKYCGTGGRTRTDTLSPEPDFESGASTIPPHPHLSSIHLNPSKSQRHRRLTIDRKSTRLNSSH